MNKKNKRIAMIIGFLIALLLAFIAGGYSYRAGLLSKLKMVLIPTPQPTASATQIPPDFTFEFLVDPLPASMNSLPLPTNNSPLRFLIAGHVYGKPGDEEFHPALTFLTNIALINKTMPDFVVLLGDTVWSPSEENFNDLDLLVLNQFEVPVFNAVGNHDVTSNRDLYQSRYGSTVFAFRYKDQLFFILDTNIKYYELTNDQYAFVTDTIQEQSPNLKAIHLFMHHLLFLEEGEIVGKQLLKPNEGDGRSVEFLAFLETELMPISKSIPVTLYAGDVGAFQGGNLSPLYKKFPDHNIVFLATGLGSNPYDSILMAEYIEDGSLDIQPLSLTGREMNAIDTYTFDYWLKR
ncbi:MAG: metallophosphoesterase [Anaerolineales bacterium]|nr:metallophosphoesterase [Anaerolineales bacterium]